MAGCCERRSAVTHRIFSGTSCIRDRNQETAGHLVVVVRGGQGGARRCKTGGVNICKYLNPISNTKYRNCFSFVFIVYVLLCFGVPAWRLRKGTV